MKPELAEWEVKDGVLTIGIRNTTAENPDDLLHECRHIIRQVRKAIANAGGGEGKLAGVRMD